MDAKPNPYMASSEGTTNPPPPPSGPDADAKPGPLEPTDSAARVLVEELIRLKYHPVILCGTTGAGKTTTLASLCAYLRRSKVCDVDFGPWPSSGGGNDEKRRLKFAEQFYENKVSEFLDGIGPGASGHVLGLPYIVPIEVIPTSDQLAKINAANLNVEPVRLAFVDMSGELFKPESEDRPASNGLSDIEKLLFLYPKGVSVLLFGPHTTKDGYTDTEESYRPESWQEGTPFNRRKEHPDTALKNALRVYRNKRSSKRGDRLLFLLTKWDLVVGGVDSEAFSSPDRQTIEDELSGRFPESWSTFKTMRIHPRAKWVMQYCAGVMQGRTVMAPEEGTPASAALDRYAKVMWNWLYRGATRDAQCPEGLMLFPELLPPKPTGLAARLAQGLGR